MKIKDNRNNANISNENMKNECFLKDLNKKYNKKNQNVIKINLTESHSHSNSNSDENNSLNTEDYYNRENCEDKFLGNKRLNKSNYNNSFHLDKINKENNISISKDVYAKEMRRCFTNKEMLKSDFSINQHYFLSKVGKYWGKEENKKLKLIINENKNVTDDYLEKIFDYKFSKVHLKLRRKLLDFININEDE